MTKDKRIIFIASAIILALALVLNTVAFLVSFFSVGSQKIQNVELAPQPYIDIDGIYGQDEQMRRKFDIYLFEKTEGNSDIAEFFSYRQVEDINNAKKSGVVFSLTTKEIIYLLHDTIERFYENDIIRITDNNGNTHEFLGINYYDSDEYLNNFRGLDIGRTDISYDINKDIYFVVKTRIEVLSSYYQSFSDSTYVISNSSRTFSEDELDFLCSRIEMIDFGYIPNIDEKYFALSKLLLDGFRFSNGKIMFFHNITQDSPSVNEAFPSASAPYEAGIHKYDRNGKVVVIEVYRKWSKELVARLRFDSKRDEEIIDNICSILKKERPYFQHIDENMPYVLANYRIAVYFNGIPFLHDDARSRAIIFDPDGDIDMFAFTDDEDIFDEKANYFKNGRELTEYLHKLVIDYINNSVGCYENPTSKNLMK